MCWEKMMYFDNLLFKIIVAKTWRWLEWVCTNYVACPMTTLHRESWLRMWGRSQTWKWIHFFYFEGLNQIVLELEAVFLQRWAQRDVKWGWGSLHLSQATAWIREIDEVICIEVQHWNTTLCLFLHFAFLKNTVKARLNLLLKQVLAFLLSSLVVTHCSHLHHV